MKKMLALVVLFCSLPVMGDTAIKKPVLLRLVGPDSLTSDLMMAGTPSQPVYFFRDPDGLRLRVEKTGDLNRGFTRRYNFVGPDGGYVEIQDLFIFHHQGLPYWPVVITVNGTTIAGFLDSGPETKRLGKKVYAEFQKLPSDFQRVLYNFCIFGSDMRADVGTDAGEVGILLSENWNSPGLPTYKVTVTPVRDENAVPNFQRLFTE